MCTSIIPANMSGWASTKKLPNTHNKRRNERRNMNIFDGRTITVSEGTMDPLFITLSVIRMIELVSDEPTSLDYLRLDVVDLDKAGDYEELGYALSSLISSLEEIVVKYNYYFDTLEGGGGAHFVLVPNYA